MGGGQDRHVIQMIANASLDVIEDVVKRNTAMSVFLFAAFRPVGRCTAHLLDLDCAEWLVVLLRQVPQVCGQVQRVDGLGVRYPWQ